MTHEQLDPLCACYNISTTITMRAPTPDELLSNTWEDRDEILVPIVAFTCRIKVPLPTFVRQFFSELPLHPFQTSLGIWAYG